MFLAELLKQKFKVRFTESPLTTAGHAFGRGSLIIRRGDNAKRNGFDEELIALANKHGRELIPVASGMVSKGPDFGSPDIKLVNIQRIAMLSGEGTSSLSYGALWHFFEQQLHYPVTSLNTAHLGYIDLNKYDVLIVPSGNYRSVLNESTLDKLKTWIRQGGKVIAIERALHSFAGKDGFGLQYKTNDTTDSDELIPYADRERENAKNLITGAIFKTHIDNTHPMAYGYDKHYFSLKLGNTAFSYLDSGYTVGRLGSSAKNISGFAGSRALEALPNTLVFGETRMGRGSLIYMVDNPIFRSFWENGKLFLVNSIFFVNNNSFEL